MKTPDNIYVDGMESGSFTSETLRTIRSGDVDCITVTCGFWDDAVESMDSIARWRELIEENSDVAGIARNADDIRRLRSENRTAVLLGFQNTSSLQGRIRFVRLFAELGVRVFQLTYNNQNDVGSSCYEPGDAGLTRFGYEVVDELNRNGILVDLSHVGERTCKDAIAASSKPVAITHANAASLYAHPRNVSDSTIKELAARGGVIGCALYPNLAGPDYSKSLNAWCEMVLKTADIAGIEHVGIGSDLGGGTTEADLAWMRQGRWTLRENYGAASASSPGDEDPQWFTSMESFAGIADGLAGRGLNSSEVSAVMGGNWMRLYSEVMA
ncbi:dipeptidase [Paenarthrobacter nitroguajacolicus]|uniref:dipeptidase n=1 Tax=Paenarthrobacter nitroguajacolicus TaxID=211146 RepID=UPI003ADE7DB5